VKEECLSKLILFGEGSIRRALREFEVHYHGERNHQGKGNVLLFPCGEVPTTKRGPIDLSRRPRRSSQALPPKGRMSFLGLYGSTEVLKHTRCDGWVVAYKRNSPE